MFPETLVQNKHYLLVYSFIDLSNYSHKFVAFIL